MQLVKKSEKPQRYFIPPGKFDIIGCHKCIFQTCYLLAALSMTANFKNVLVINHKISLLGSGNKVMCL